MVNPKAAKRVIRALRHADRHGCHPVVGPITPNYTVSDRALRHADRHGGCRPTVGPWDLYERLPILPQYQRGVVVLFDGTTLTRNDRPWWRGRNARPRWGVQVACDEWACPNQAMGGTCCDLIIIQGSPGGCNAAQGCPIHCRGQGYGH